METINVPGDVFLYRCPLNRHHGNCFSGRQPVRTIATTCIVTNVAGVAEEERHRRELSHARAGMTCFMIIY